MEFYAADSSFSLKQRLWSCCILLSVWITAVFVRLRISLQLHSIFPWNCLVCISVLWDGTDEGKNDNEAAAALLVCLTISCLSLSAFLFFHVSLSSNFHEMFWVWYLNIKPNWNRVFHVFSLSLFHEMIWIWHWSFSYLRSRVHLFFLPEK